MRELENDPPRLPAVGDQVLIRAEIVEAQGNYLQVKIAGPGQGFRQFCWVARGTVAELIRPS